MIGATITAVATGWLVIATRMGHRSAVVAKPVASLGFLIVAFSQPFDADSRAVLLTLGLVAGALGDVALMGRSDAAFMSGLGAFLAGHLAYLVAFACDVRAGGWMLVGVATATALGWLVTRWLRPHLNPPFTVAVPLYITVICLMVAAGLGTAPLHPLAALGAVLFAASDLFVARQKFVDSDPNNPTVGLPLYYLAQLLIAFSI